MIVWDVGTGDALCSVELPDIPLCASWNWEGSRVVVSCKDKKIRILDPREENIVKVCVNYFRSVKSLVNASLTYLCLLKGVDCARWSEANAGCIFERWKHFHDWLLAHERTTTRLVGQSAVLIFSLTLKNV